MTQPLSVTLQDIQNAHARILPYIHHTPLLEIAPAVYLKAEHLQVVKSFKPRGACNAMLCLSETERQKGVVARSSGNFAQGLSYIGKKLGVRVTIVMPEHAPKVKVASTKSLGATVILKGHQHAEAQAVVDHLAQTHRFTKMHPFDHPDVIAGQGTAMLEICEDIDTVDYFFCPISGGGLLAGCATALKALHPHATIIGVEPEGASDYAQSRQTGHPVQLSEAHSIADGLLAPSVGTWCRPLLDAYVDEVMVLSDTEILDAMHWLHHEKGQTIEPSGAASVAAYLRYKKSHAIDGKTVVCMASGGNVDPELLQ